MLQSVLVSASVTGLNNQYMLPQIFLLLLPAISNGYDQLVQSSVQGLNRPVWELDLPLGLRKTFCEELWMHLISLFSLTWS